MWRNCGNEEEYSRKGVKEGIKRSDRGGRDHGLTIW